MPGLKKIDPINVRIGRNLKFLRELHEIKQEEAAKKIGLTRCSIINGNYILKFLGRS